jgi:hypothetical protein
MPATDYGMPAPPVAPAPAREPAAEEPLTPAGGGASWSIVGESKGITEEPPKEKDKKQPKAAAPAGSTWDVSSGVAPGEEDTEEVKAPGAAMAVAQYAVLVVGLVMVLIGVLVMVANSKVT